MSSPFASPSTHSAVVTTAIRAPLSISQIPYTPLAPGEVRVRVIYTASGPLDLHQNDGGLLVTHPQILGDSIAGIVLEVSTSTHTNNSTPRFSIGDNVFGFVWRTQREKAHQEIVISSDFLLGKVPPGISMQAATTVPSNFVTAFHALTKDLGLPLPWPKSESFVPEHKDAAILVWGGSSSAGQYVLQVLKWYGYCNVLATASRVHHGLLRELGAGQLFDYTEGDVYEQLRRGAGEGGVRFVLDCIGSKKASLAPIAQLATKGTTVAALLPVIVRDATEDEAPEYAMDVQSSAQWADGVVTRGVRTHHYLENGFFKEHLQPHIMPDLLERGAVKPNKFRIVEGATLLERAQKALDMLRRKEVSGERLVWRVSEG